MPEVFVSNKGLSSIVSRELKRGKLRKLGSKVYTTNLTEPVELLSKRHAWFIVKELFPGSVVAPDLVEGTLLKEFQWIQGLRTPFQRAVYMMFLITEVHLFADGNGRCMNIELIAQDQARIIIPTVFRNNYLSALKALTHQNEADALIRTLDFAQKYTSLID